MGVVADLFTFAKPGEDPVRKLEALYSAAKAARKPYDRDVLLNLAFFLDEQYVEYQEDVGTIRRLPVDDKLRHTPRPVVNKIMYFVNQSHATTVSNRPNPAVLPATDDTCDISDAAVGQAYVEHIADPLQANWDMRLEEAAIWAIIGGTGWFKTTFSSKNNRPDIDAPNPLDIYCDPYAKKWEDVRYVIHTQFLDVEQVYEAYGVEVAPEAVERQDIIQAAMLREMGHSPAVTGVQVRELWMLPCKRYPQGVFVTWMRGKILQAAAPFPYDHKQLPFHPIGVLLKPSTLLNGSFVTYLRSGQMEVNQYHQQRIQIRKGFAAPKWFIDSAMADEMVMMPDDSPNQILIGDTKGDTLPLPTILQGAQMADNNEGEWIGAEMMNIVGLHEVSQGQVPGRVESAKAIDSLKQSDASRLSHLNKGINVAQSRIFWQVLQLARQYVSTEVVAVSYSRDGMPEVKHFMTDTFKPGMRVRVSETTGLSLTPEAKQEQLLNYWNAGIIQDPARMAELLDLPFPNFIEAKAFDIKLARNENYVMAGGDAIVPNSWDDHEVHIQEHNNYRKTTDYLHLPDKTKSIIEFHVQMHQQFQQSALQQQIQNQQALTQTVAPNTPSNGTVPAQTAPGAEPSMTGP